jgi:hypothetical protein
MSFNAFVLLEGLQAVTVPPVGSSPTPSPVNSRSKGLDETLQVASFRIAPTFLLDDANQVVDGFKLDADGVIRREYDRKPESVEQAVAPTFAKNPAACATLWIQQGTTILTRGGDSFFCTR